jgi:anaerobic selenocysteine-containing dehydrogenase
MKYPLILVTGARIVEYTHWQMKEIPGLRALAPYPVAWIHTSTANNAGVIDGDEILVETRKGSVRVRASVTRDMKPGVVSLAHGWEDELNANNLVELENHDSVTGYCEYRNVACRVKKAA